MPTKVQLQQALEALMERGCVLYPMYDHTPYCWYCSMTWNHKLDKIVHADDCPWMRAQALLNGTIEGG